MFKHGLLIYAMYKMVIIHTVLICVHFYVNYFVMPADCFKISRSVHATTFVTSMHMYKIVIVHCFDMFAFLCDLFYHVSYCCITNDYV